MLFLFDIDDTLLDDRTSVRLAATALHATVGSAMSADGFCSTWNDALERHYARYLKGEVSFEDQRRDRVREVIDSSLTDLAADHIIEEYVAAYEASWRLFSDVVPCLDRLSDCRLGIVSNGKGEWQRRKLEATGIAARFEHIVISADIGFAKPDPAIFHRACALFGEDPSEAVYTGDRYDVDAQGARAAGLRGVWLDRRREATATHEPPLIAGLERLELYRGKARARLA